MADTLTNELQRFAGWATETFRTDGRFDEVRVLRPQPGADLDLAIALQVSAKSRYEIGVDSGQLELQIGFVTEDRALNESVEQAIQESGDTLAELMEAELEELGHDSVEMEHFFDRPAFRYITRVDLDEIEELNDKETYDRVEAIIEACYAVFQGWVEEA